MTEFRGYTWYHSEHLCHSSRQCSGPVPPRPTKNFEYRLCPSLALGCFLKYFIYPPADNFCAVNVAIAIRHNGFRCAPFRVVRVRLRVRNERGHSLALPTRIPRLKPDS